MKINGKKMAWNDPLTAKLRSVTPKGVAEVMVEQWGMLPSETEEMQGVEFNNA